MEDLFLEQLTRILLEQAKEIIRIEKAMSEAEDSSSTEAKEVDMLND